MRQDPFEENCVYHIYNRANGEENVFREEKNYDFFLKKYYRYIQPVAETYAWCLMANHFHMMIRIRRTEELDKQTFEKFRTFEKFDKNHRNFGKYVSRQFASLFSSYTQAYNKVYGRTGSLFQPSIKRKKVVGVTYFAQLIFYIHNNPVKHGFVNDIYAWPHSSVHLFTTNELSNVNGKQLFKSSKLLESSTRRQIINWFGGAKNLRQMHRQAKSLQSIFD